MLSVPSLSALIFEACWEEGWFSSAWTLKPKQAMATIESNIRFRKTAQGVLKTPLHSVDNKVK